MFGKKLGFARRLGHKSLNPVCMRLGQKRKHTNVKLQQFQNMQYPNSVAVNKVERLKKMENGGKLGE